MMRPIGYFVHHQGRGHAERCLALIGALPQSRPVRIFCARDTLFPVLPPQATLTVLPSLFEPTGHEAPGLADQPTPSSLHCAPLGWPGIRLAMGMIAGWFSDADPALMICDVSAEIAQLCRICSVPHVKILQHGDRSDDGHRLAYEGAVGLLAPFSARLAQPEWSDAMLAKTCFAGGLGRSDTIPEREVARRRIGVAEGREMILVMSGGGGSGFAQAPLAVGARQRSAAQWVTIGTVERDWHATEPGNIDHRGWVGNVADYIAAADCIIASTGNTTCQQILAAGKPWLAVPEWRYFDEQHRKAECLAAAGLAVRRPHLPASAQAWDRALGETYARHDPARQRAAIDDRPAETCADWLEALIARLWRDSLPIKERTPSR
ncbi:glycosyltransferase family protein [Swaminathania salitolerans]|uniref:Glycosyl transferase family 28 C-terminal domain-containing protein n=1 Tax=Swaminathania salitolerans TaxID=182838 RepID=A0A511BLZ2_9PROT|nr:hypothetical protein [Swaminathania salitolerans]GEL01112.1 hypothetical protein SSA02_02750 [Swaminathania salitolerans]